MTRPTCDVCTKPVADQARLCGRCSDLLARDLGDVPALKHDLDITRWRQASTGGSATGIVVRAGDDRLSWDQRAASAERDLYATVIGYAQLVAAQRGLLIGSGTIVGLSRFLITNLDWLRHHARAGEVHDEVRSVVREARRVVDRPADSRPLGRCGWVSDEARVEAIVSGVPVVSCAAELRARPDASHVQCRVCGHELAVADRLELMGRLAEDYLLTASELTSAITAIARPIPLGTITSWASRGRLIERGRSDDDRPLYLVRDVLDLLAQDPKGRRDTA